MYKAFLKPIHHGGQTERLPNIESFFNMDNKFLGWPAKLFWHSESRGKWKWRTDVLRKLPKQNLTTQSINHHENHYLYMHMQCESQKKGI